MKKILLIIILICLTPALTVLAEPLAPRRTIRLAGDHQFPPFEYLDSSGQYRGFNVEFMQALAIELGVYIEFVPLPWREAVKALQEGQVDAIQGMKVTPERQRDYLFTEPYLTTAHAIFVSVDNEYIRELTDLRGGKVAVQAGDFGQELLSSEPGVRLVLVENQAEGLDLLANGEVDAFVGNRLTARYYAQRRGVTGRIKQVGGPINPATYAVAARKGNDELVSLLNEGIRRLQRNDTHEKIYRKWFGERLAAGEPWVRWLAAGAGLLALIGAVSAALIYRWNLALKREVARRTADLDQVHRLNTQIINNAPAGIVTINADGLIVTANELACALAGEELAGRPLAVTPLAACVGAERLQAALADGEGCSEGERSVGDGATARTYRYSIAPLPASGGVVLLIREVTAEMQMARQLLQHAKMETVGRMVAGLAHEIRNPLTSLKAFAQLLPVKYDNPAFRKDALAYVPTQIERLDNLVTDLLDYSRPRTRQREHLDAGEVLASAAALLRPQAELQGTRLEVLPGAAATLIADRHQIHQILMNLTLNSLQALGEGGAVTLAAFAQGGSTVLEVGDSGPGIAPEDLDRIFEPFFTRRVDGTGLGLWISYQYTRENGGVISVVSHPGQGARLRLEFPAASEGELPWPRS